MMGLSKERPLSGAFLFVASHEVQRMRNAAGTESTVKLKQWSLATADLVERYTQFHMSRQAMRCSPATLTFYRYTAGAFLTWAELHGATSAQDIGVETVRAYLADLVGAGKSDTTVHDHARAVKTLLRFWHAEGYLSRPVVFAMPKLELRRLPMLNADQLAQLLAACHDARNRAIVLCMADSGLVAVHHGKGGKDRSAVIGPTSRRALLSYRPDLLSPISANEPLFLSRSGDRMSGSGLLLMMRRLAARTGIPVTPHALRRTYAILYLRSGGDPLHLQAQLGHASLEMVRHYAQMVDDDLLEDHRAHSPIENLGRLQQRSGSALPRLQNVGQTKNRPRQRTGDGAETASRLTS